MDTRDVLTVREALVARLAADGHTDPQIGVRLFISPGPRGSARVKVFSRLGISSGRRLRHRLA